MRYFLILISVFCLVTNCSLNKNSQYWTDDSHIKTIDQNNKNNVELNSKNLPSILKKSGDITSMTVKEYEIFIKDYTKKSKFPDISK